MTLQTYENKGGPKIVSGSVPVIEVNGNYFRNMSRTGHLLPFEDWRKSPDERAEDLASRLSMEEIAGLMVHTAHQHVPYINDNSGLANQYYRGKEFAESGAASWEPTDEQRLMVSQGHVRHFLMAQIKSPETAARWTNALQEWAEDQPWAIPMCFSSDPRHGAGGDVEYKIETAGLSGWPEGVAMASCFDAKTCWNGARTMAKELRAMGVTTFLGPQIDLATEPRWMRANDTFGQGLKWNQVLTKTFCDAMQTTPGARNGWGDQSVATMVKHWPGGGTGEGGRDAHYVYGAYAVYPKKNFTLHQQPFTEAAFRLAGPTETAAAVMPYYTVSHLEDEPRSEEVGNAFNEWIIRDLLRGEARYDGVVCTDWGVVEDPPEQAEIFAGKCYGVEHLTKAQRCLKAIQNGVDQIAGNVSTEDILEAFRLGEESFCREGMEERARLSAFRLLRNMIRLGLFENPYVDLEESRKVWGSTKSYTEGLLAQERSAVLLKNKERTLPLRGKIRVYVPQRHIDKKINFLSMEDEARDFMPVSADLLSEYFEIAASPEEADAAIVFMESPDSAGYLRSDVEKGGNGYLPISLQYRPYTAEHARETSIAGGSPQEGFTNRSYKGKTSVVSNERDLDNLIEMRRIMEGKKVIACIGMNHPMVMAEVDPYADAVIAEFGISKRAVLELISGKAEPSGRLAVRLPRDMDSLETHSEDTPFDYPAFEDEEHHVYDFGFGMNFDGVLPPLGEE